MVPIIETNRLVLRKFTLDDADGVYEFGSNEEVQRYTGNELLNSPEEARELIENVFLKDYATYGYGRFAVVYKEDQKVIGFAGLKYIPEMDITDIGFRFLPEYWNQGIATEASVAILQYGFETLQLKRIVGIAMPENLASCKVLEKIGLKFFKIDEYDGDGGAYRWYECKINN